MSEAALAAFLELLLQTPSLLHRVLAKGNLEQEKSVNNRQKPEEEKEEECLSHYFLNPFHLALNTDTKQFH